MMRGLAFLRAVPLRRTARPPWLVARVVAAAVAAAPLFDPAVAGEGRALSAGRAILSGGLLRVPSLGLTARVGKGWSLAQPKSAELVAFLTEGGARIELISAPWDAETPPQALRSVVQAGLMGARNRLRSSASITISGLPAEEAYGDAVPLESAKEPPVRVHLAGVIAGETVVLFVVKAPDVSFAQADRQFGEFLKGMRISLPARIKKTVGSPAPKQEKKP